MCRFWVFSIVKEGKGDVKILFCHYVMHFLIKLTLCHVFYEQISLFDRKNQLEQNLQMDECKSEKKIETDFRIIHERLKSVFFTNFFPFFEIKIWFNFFKFIKIMTHVKINPFAPTVRFQNFDKFIADVFNTPIFNDDAKNGMATPSVNVAENDAEYRLEVAAPGLVKEDFKINIEDTLLTISAEKKVENEKKEGEKYIRREFGYTAFKRSFTLPETIDVANIKATYDNGVLHLSLPKVEVKKTMKTIDIL